MEDCEPIDRILDREQHMILATYHLVKALGDTRNLNNDMRRILADLDVELSTMIRLNEGEAKHNREIDGRLISAQETIMNLHSNHSKIWDSSPSIILEYLQAVDEVQRLAGSLESVTLTKSRKQKEILDQAQSILQIVMGRLQEELVHILAQNKLCLEPECVSIPTCEEGSMYEESIVSNEDNSVDNVSPRESSSTETEEYVMDLVHPDVIPQIKSIAKVMFSSHYAQEFCQTFVKFWRDTFAEYLRILNMEQLSIEDVLKMEWKCLNSRIKKWRRAVKSIIGVYLASAKRLFDQVLGEYGRSSSVCLFEASKASVFCLMNFGQAVAIGPHRPEWLYCLLDMHDLLATLIPDIDALFPEEIGSLVKVEFHELLKRLGDSAKIIFLEFGNYIASDRYAVPIVIGGIHLLTKYVVNYILCISEYGDTLNSLLETQDKENTDTGRIVNLEQNSSRTVADHLQSFTSILEGNLDKKSNLYKDIALKHIFMMNNIHYMVQKVRDSGVRTYFGDEWIKSHISKFRQHAMCYERATWSSILTFLRNDGKTGKATLKLRCRDFANAFEDLYKNQTGWCVPDQQLREELRISASKTVIQAYRNFVTNITNSIGDKHIKYTEQDLETYILDLLDGTSKPLNHLRKR